MSPEDINGKFEEARELIENDEHDDTLESVAEDFESPEIEPPKYENDTPLKPLLDTIRGHDEQLTVYDERNQFGKLESRGEL